MSARLDAAYVAQVRALRRRLSEFVTARFGAGGISDADLERYVAQVVPVVLAGRRQVSALTDAWLTQTLREMGLNVRAQGPIDTDSLRGTPAREVYSRPFTEARWKVSQGATFEAAMSAGLARVASIVVTDAQMAKVRTVARILAGSPVQGFRRTLTGNENCGMCRVATTQRYSKSDLMPIHPGCDCGVEPLLEGDWDQSAADAQLAATHDALEDRFGKSDPGARAIDYRKALLVEEHGEIGPVLTVARHRFTSRDNIPNL